MRRPGQFKRLGRAHRTVSRPYGGVLTAQEVRERITRAFMIEEVKSIKQRNALGEGKKKRKGGKGKKKAPKA